MQEPAKQLEGAEEKPKEEEEKKALVTVGSHPIGGLIPQTFEQMWRLSTIMAASGMMPKGIDKTESVFVAIQMGLEVGLSPMQAVQNIAVINNRPAIWGDGALGLVRASGDLEDFQEWFSGEQFKDDWTAHCKVKRKGYEPRENSFTLAEAKAAGLYPPSDKFSPWGKYPRRMLQMRARSWALRDEFTDVLKGLQIREEQADIILAPTAEGSYAMPEVPADESRLAAFEEMASGIENGERIEEYIKHLADHFDTTAEQIKTEAVESEDTWQDFVSTYRGWTEKHPSEEEKLPCPWPDCNTMCKPGKGMKKHLTQQHEGKEPPEHDVTTLATQEEESTATEPPTPPGDDSGMEPNMPVECYKCKRTVMYEDAIVHKGKDEIERYWCGWEDCK